jgi:hypothetical protein
MPYVKNIFQVLLTRLVHCQSETTSFSREFVNFLSLLLLLDKPGLNADIIIGVFDSIQTKYNSLNH